MSVRSCKVTIKDLDGVSHTVDVTAATLYEAVALGIAAIRTDEWVQGIPEGLNPVKVQVKSIPVEHEVRMKDFLCWLDGTSQRPRDIIQKNRIREILGMERLRKS